MGTTVNVDNDIIEELDNLHHGTVNNNIRSNTTCSSSTPVGVASATENDTARNTSSDNIRREEVQDNGERTIAIEYGTLISCIDFGDQLGSLTVAPLVAILNVSRENNFLHLDYLILICSLTNMVVSLGLL